MVRGKFISLNRRGISNYRKRRTIFTCCRKQKADVIFLQETHSTEKNETQWKREWGGPFYCSHGASNARGVAILNQNNFDCTVEQKVADAHGRFLILKVLLKGKKAEEQILNKQLQDAHVTFQNNRSRENSAALNMVQGRIEKLYEKKVEGIIVRSRARWHEYGEKNSKYFFNLEKRNHIKKQIRKLRMCGMITTDPFKILEAEKTFYENLYKSKRNCCPQNESYFKYEDLPIPTLSHELRQSGEGAISLEECTEILNSFPLNKVPGNDGLPVEFYKTFWVAVGNLLVECFNESFEKGEMSSSQKQAVITLI